MAELILSAFADEYDPDFETQLKALNKLGISYIEVRFVDGKNISALSDAELERAKILLDRYGIKVSAIGSPLGKIKLDDDIDAHIELTERVCCIANYLGAKYIRMFSFYPGKDKAVSECKTEVIEALSRMLDVADKHGVVMCHENEARIYGEAPEACLELLKHFNGRLKAVFDMGNFALEGYDPIYAYGLLKDYVEYFHIKDGFKHGAIVPAGKGEAKIAQILSEYALSDGKDTFISLEPHLTTFSGLSALTENQIKHEFVYETPQIAFEVAAEMLKEILKVKTFVKDKLTVNVYESRSEMGKAAALDIKNRIVDLLKEKNEINMIFAAAPSQNEVLDALVNDKDIEWGRINAYHMDEYIGLDKDAPQGFGNFLKDHIFGRVPFKSVRYIDITAKDPEAESERYSALLEANPTDIVVMGIGENGHIAFNDPPVADFNDKRWVKPGKLDDICRNPQVNDGCFKCIEDVPTHALTLTVPTLVKAPNLFCIVPAKTKAWAVKETLTASIDEHCPASILRTREGAVLYLDPDSASLI